MTFNPQITESGPSTTVELGPYLDWPAVFAGIILASAISIVLLAFGAGIGLSFSDITSKGAVIGTSVAAAIWFLWVEVSSFMAGAYLTGRLRRSARSLSTHETEVRDGSHGVVVWAGCVVLGTALAFSGASSLVSSAGSVVKTATQAAATASQGAAPMAMQYYSDALLRSAPGAAAAAPTNDRSAVSTEVGTILARSALTKPTDDDKAYLAQVVSQQTGVSADDAKTRVDKVYADIDAAKADAAKAADTARRVGVIAAFLLAASLLVSAAAAFWAAAVGGNHKDESAVFAGFFKRTNFRQ